MFSWAVLGSLLIPPFSPKPLLRAPLKSTQSVFSLAVVFLLLWSSFNVALSPPQVLYKEDLGTGTPIPVTPEVERVKRNQEQLSSVLGGGQAVLPLTPLKQLLLTSS